MLFKSLLLGPPRRAPFLGRPPISRTHCVATEAEGGSLGDWVQARRNVEGARENSWDPEKGLRNEPHLSPDVLFMFPFQVYVSYTTSHVLP